MLTTPLTLELSLPLHRPLGYEPELEREERIYEPLVRREVFDGAPLQLEFPRDIAECDR